MSFSGQALRSVRPVLPPSMLPTARSMEFDAPPELEAVGNVVSFARNETIFDEGEEITASYKVVSGVVRLCRLTEDGRRQIAGFRLPGDLIGMEWTGEYEMTAEAVRDVTVVRYVRTQRAFLLMKRPFSEFAMISVGEFLAGWVFAISTQSSIFVQTCVGLAALLLVRYTLRKVFLHDLRGIRGTPTENATRRLQLAPRTQNTAASA